MFDPLIKLILEWYPYLDSIYLYGSYAKGTQTEKSDIDICILMPFPYKISRKDKHLDKLLTHDMKKDVHVIFCTNANAWCHTLIHKNLLYQCPTEILECLNIKPTI